MRCFSRREFIQSATLSCGAFLVPHGAFAGEKPNLRFGAFSDPHVLDGNPDYWFKRSVSIFEWFRDQRIDAVLCCGDMAMDGVDYELKIFADAWYAVFPGDKAPDGRPVEKLFVYGNHDSVGYRYGDFAKKKWPGDEAAQREHSIYFDHARHWEQTFREPYAPIYAKTVKGYTFIGQHWDEADDKLHGWHYYDHRRLGPWLDKHGAALRGDRPFFYFQHPNLKDTAFGSRVWGHDHGYATAALAKYPNAVAFAGHSHSSPADPRAIWQGDFTAIGLGSTASTGGFSENRGKAGYENYDAPWGKDSNVYDRVKTMPNPELGPCYPLEVVDVYDDKIVIRNFSFATETDFYADWVIPLPFRSSDKPYAFATRAKAAQAPQFPKGAKLVCREAKAKTRRTPKDEPVEKATLRLDFPAADAVKGARAFEYEFRATPADAAAAFTTWFVPTKGMAAPIDDPSAHAAQYFEIARDRLPKGPCVLEVTPLDAYGNRGRSITGRTRG